MAVPRLWCAQPMLDADLLESTRAGTSGLLRDGFYARASQMGEKALKLAEEQYGPLHPDIAPLLDDLGTLYRYQAEYKKAEQEYDWALAIREKALGADDPGVAESLRYLASLDTDLARYAEAESDYRRAIQIQQKAFGENSVESAKTMEALGNLECLMNKGPEASTLLDHCLAIEEKTWGADDPRLSETLEDLAWASEIQKDPALAEGFLKRSLAINQRGSTDSLEAADSIERLAAFYRRMGRENEAKASYGQAVKTWDKLLLNPDPPEPYLHRGGLVNLALGRWKRAEVFLDRSLKLRTEAYGPAHPKVAFALEDLASLHEASGQKANAVAELKRAKAILEGLFDPGHPELEKLEKKLESLR